MSLVASEIPNAILHAFHDRTRGEFRAVPGWTITKMTPKTPTWARSRHGAARVTHRIRYVLEARSTKPRDWMRADTMIQRGLRPLNVEHYVMAVWVCGSKSHDWRGFDLMPDPVKARRPYKERCHGCEKPDKEAVV